VKFIILVFILIIGLIWVNRDVANTNLGIKTSFSTQNSPRLPFRYAEAMIYVIYPYGAFHQINYVCFNLAEGQGHLLVSYWQNQVISELKEPRKTFPRASCYGVLAVVIIYNAVMLSYVSDRDFSLTDFKVNRGTTGSYHPQGRTIHLRRNRCRSALFPTDTWACRYQPQTTADYLLCTKSYFSYWKYYCRHIHNSSR
jgi:amino acid transporter